MRSLATFSARQLCRPHSRSWAAASSGRRSRAAHVPWPSAVCQPQCLPWSSGTGAWRMVRVRMCASCGRAGISHAPAVCVRLPDIVTPTGYIRKCMEDVFDGVTVADELRRMFIDEDSEHVDLCVMRADSASAAGSAMTRVACAVQQVRRRGEGGVHVSHHEGGGDWRPAVPVRRLVGRLPEGDQGVATHRVPVVVLVLVWVGTGVPLAPCYSSCAHC